MAERNKDLLGRLADLSEEAIQRLAEAPGADRVLQALKALGDKVDELQRRTSGFEELEGRLSALEKKVLSPVEERGSDRVGRRRRSPDRSSATAAIASSSPPAMSVGVWKPASSSSTATATSQTAEHEREARPRGRECGGDDRAAKRVPARPGRVEGDEMDAVAGRAPGASACGGRRARRPPRRPTPRSRWRHAASTPPAATSRNEMTTWPGSVTIWATAAPTGWNCAWRSGTTDSRRVGGPPTCRPRSGIGWSTAHWSRPVSAPEATRPPSAANAAAAAAARLRSAAPAAVALAGTTSKRAGVVPIGSPSTSSGSGSAASIATRRRPQKLDLRMREVPAAVELRRGREEVELVHVADRHDVEEAVVLARRRARASSRRRGKRPFATITSCIAAFAPHAAVELDRHLACSARRGTRASARRRTSPSRRAPSTSRSPAARPSRSSPPSRRSRSSAAGSPSHSTRPTSIVRVSPSSATRTASSKRSGSPCVRPKSSPVPDGEDARSPRPSRRRRSRPRSPSRRRRRRRAASLPASRAASARWPGYSDSTSSPRRPSSAARSPQLRPALAGRAVPDAGLTRKRIAANRT